MFMQQSEITCGNYCAFILCLGASTWSSTSGAELGSYGKSPVGRSAVGLTRAHPYAPPTARGGHF